jgi:hypothetical protein
VTVFDKAMTVLISVGLFTLGFLALCLAALFLSGCAHSPTVPVIPAQAIDRITLLNVLPGWTLVCIEDPDLNWATPDEPRTYHRTVCVELDAVRHWVAHTRAAD